MMFKTFVLVGGVLLAATPTSLLAQVGGCSACETAIRDKLDELDDRTSKTNLLVKTVDRKLDPLAVKVDVIDTKLTAVQAKLDQLAAGVGLKGAVVIDFGAGVVPPFYENPRVGDPFLDNADQIATKYCLAINYQNGKALVVKDTIATGFGKGKREIPKLVCYQ